MDSQEGSARGKRTVLILDDEDILREVLSRELRQAGYLTVDFVDKEDGYDWACENQVDLILTDIKSRRMDGFSFLKYIKANEMTRDIPVIMVTGFSSLTVAIQATKDGAADFVSKPYELDDLLKTIDRVLTSSARRRGRGPKRLPDLFIARRSDLRKMPWYHVRRLLAELLRAQRSRTLLFEAESRWTEYFLIEDEKQLVGCCLCRPTEFGTLPASQIVGMRYWLQSKGLRFGVIYPFFDPSPEDLEFAELLGISIFGSAPTLDMLLKISGGKSAVGESLVPSERGLSVSPLAGAFQGFCGEVWAKAQALKVPTILRVLSRGVENESRSVTCELTEYGSFHFRDESGDSSAWLGQADFLRVLARLWRRRRIEKEYLPGDEFGVACTAELLTHLGVAAHDGDACFLTQ